MDFLEFLAQKNLAKSGGGGLQIANISLQDMEFLMRVYLSRAKIERAVNLRRRKNFIFIISENRSECQKFLSQSRAPSRVKRTATESRCAAAEHSSGPMILTLPGSDSTPQN